MSGWDVDAGAYLPTSTRALARLSKEARLKLDAPRRLDHAPYRGEARTERADDRTVARHVRSLRDLIAADPRYSAAYHVGRLGLSGALAAQVLAACEEAE